MAPKKRGLASLDADSFLNLDVEAAEAEAPPPRARRPRPAATEAAPSAKKHKSDLSRLREKDPEFYAFLESTDKQLLEFNDSDDEEEEGGVAEAAEEAGAPRAPEEEEEAPEAGASDQLLTSEAVAALCEAAQPGDSLAAVARLLRAFRAAAHYGDALGGEEEGAAAEPLRLASSTAFNQLVVFTLSHAPALLRSLLGGGGKGAGGALTYRPEQAPKWKKVQPLARSFLGNALHLQAQLRDASMVAFALRSLVPAAPLAAPFPRLTKLLLRAALARFGDGAPAARLQALRLLRALALALPAEGLDGVFRGAYRTFASNAKFATAAQAESVSFMAAGLLELFRLEPAAAYPLAFSAIRQLALLLRAALTARSKDAYRAVYCWQTVHCLELWGRVLCALAAQPADALRPLLYPLVQLLQGAARLLPAARHAPLRLRLLALLGRLGASTGAYVPLAAQALELLSCAELAKPPLAGRGGGGDYGGALRVAKAELRSPAFHAFLVERSLDVAADALLQWAYHPAFPELAHLALRELRRFAKASPAPRFQRPAAVLAEATQRAVAWVAAKRDAVDFAPKHCAPGSPQLAAFLAEERAGKKSPLEALVAQRRAAAAARAAAARVTDVRVRDGDEEEEEEEEGGKAAPREKGRKRVRAAEPLPSAAPGEDAVMELMLSDEEE